MAFLRAIRIGRPSVNSRRFGVAVKDARTKMLHDLTRLALAFTSRAHSHQTGTRRYVIGSAAYVTRRKVKGTSVKGVTFCICANSALQVLDNRKAHSD
jgi:hypothetical protein